MEMDQINGSCSFTLAFDDGIRAAIVRHNCHPNVRSIRIALNYIRECAANTGKEQSYCMALAHSFGYLH